VDLGDAVHLLGHLFLGGPPPVGPRPGGGCEEAEVGTYACERPVCP
jgi:hypothetical protein